MLESGAQFVVVDGILLMPMLFVGSWVMPMPSRPSRMLPTTLQYAIDASLHNSGMCHLVTAEEPVPFGWTMLGVMEQKNVLISVTSPALEYPVVPITKMLVLCVQVCVCVCVCVCTRVCILQTYQPNQG